MHLQRAVLGGLRSVGGEAAGTKQATQNRLMLSAML